MRQSILVAGLEQSGKTFWAEQRANEYTDAGKTAVIYNVGKDSDFSGAEICHPIEIEELYRYTPKKQIQKIKTLNSLPIFKDEKTNKMISFKSFRRFYAGKKVKIYRHRNESFLIKSFFMYLYDTLIIFDDNRASTRHGLTHEQIELFSRKNHAGTNYCGEIKQGVDLMFIYHNLDKVPEELYDYLTRVILFQLNRVPADKINDSDFQVIIENAVSELKNLPKYSYYELVLRGYPEIKQIKHIHK